MSWGEKEVTVLLLCCVTVIRQKSTKVKTKLPLTVHSDTDVQGNGIFTNTTVKKDC